MTRRTLLALPLALRLRADAAGDVWALLADTADALSHGHLSSFLDSFDPKMPGYDDLSENVAGLLAESQPQGDREGIYCSLDLVSDEGDEKKRNLEVDWILDIRQRAGAMAGARRRQNVKFSVEKQGKKWRIVALDPIGFFAPPGGK